MRNKFNYSLSILTLSLCFSNAQHVNFEKETSNQAHVKTVSNAKNNSVQPSIENTPDLNKNEAEHLVKDTYLPDEELLSLKDSLDKNLKLIVDEIQNKEAQLEIIKNQITNLSNEEQSEIINKNFQLFQEYTQLNQKKEFLLVEIKKINTIIENKLKISFKEFQIQNALIQFKEKLNQPLHEFKQIKSLAEIEKIKENKDLQTLFNPIPKLEEFKNSLLNIIKDSKYSFIVNHLEKLNTLNKEYEKLNFELLKTPQRIGTNEFVEVSDPKVVDKNGRPQIRTVEKTITNEQYNLIKNRMDQILVEIATVKSQIEQICPFEKALYIQAFYTMTQQKLDMLNKFLQYKPNATQQDFEEFYNLQILIEKKMKSQEKLNKRLAKEQAINQQLEAAVTQDKKLFDIALNKPEATWASTLWSYVPSYEQTFMLAPMIGAQIGMSYYMGLEHYLLNPAFTMGYYLAIQPQITKHLIQKPIAKFAQYFNLGKTSTSFLLGTAQAITQVVSMIGLNKVMMNFGLYNEAEWKKTERMTEMVTSQNDTYNKFSEGNFSGLKPNEVQQIVNDDELKIEFKHAALEWLKKFNKDFTLFNEAVTDLSKKQFKSIYRQLSQLIHPDKGGDLSTFTNLNTINEIFSKF